jgi:RNA polymerase sigma-70 factor (ECF subfamily)
MEQRRRAEMLEALPKLRRFARSLTGHPADGDDLTQSTIERALERGIPSGFDTTRWMFKVCKNLYIDGIRAQNVRERAAPHLVEDDPVRGERVALGELSLREVDTAMQSLSDEQRAVIALVAVEGLTYRETAEILDVPVGTVMSRLSRARATLAERLSEREPDASKVEEIAR